MTAYTIEKYLTEYVYPEQGAQPGEALPSDHEDVLEAIRIGISTCPWGDQSVGVDDNNGKLYEDDFLDLASAIGLAAQFAAEGSPLTDSTLQAALKHFNRYVDNHPELHSAA